MDEAQPFPDVWLDDRLAVGDSPIEGRGLFFSTDVPGDTVVIRLGGRLVSSAELTAMIAAAEGDPEASYVDTITIREDEHLVLPPDTPVHFGNHSCEPTLWHVSPVEVATCRQVFAGEEATVDYGTQSGAPGFTMQCQCGAGTCREVITIDDWRRPELQDRYAGHWVPALEALIQASHQGT